MKPSAGSGPVTLAIMGCGQRGRAYAVYAQQHPERCKIVAVAEPRPKTRARMVQEHTVDSSLTFKSWQAFHAASEETIVTIGRRLADAVLIAVQDHMHAELVEAFAAQGYHILCEKPMATSIPHCLRIEESIKKAGVIFGMGHVLRYSPYSQAITEIVRSGQLGDLVNVVHIEPIGHTHFAHSYVRGNWAREMDSSFSLMTKSCHDIDIICSWLSPEKPERVSSFGGLRHFRKEAKPTTAGDSTRCLSCPAERSCPYSAKKSNVVYLEPVQAGKTGWPAAVIVDGIADIENVTDALHSGPYGQCVYESRNDVCDNQVVNIQFSSGATASFTMVAYTLLQCERQTRLHFTHGEIVGDMTDFTVTDFRTGATEKRSPMREGGGHGGGDLGLIRAFTEAVRTGRQELLGTDVTEVLSSHLTVFAAEESRRKGVTVDCGQFERKAREGWLLTGKQ
ncbi:streptomycin biosynthesis protein StrI [Vararia minispora EC-137]|uniref:Streptomycin biosynthesis protein StrI n=1 Tax=Vararia minispora EC-137 TaxID=1314806 RepID=A0ACB8QQS2_9AGAM|nr:streptomycin biosynthesis protein StrI [Vararia minispora EC-137]